MSEQADHPAPFVTRSRRPQIAEKGLGKRISKQNIKSHGIEKPPVAKHHLRGE